MSSFHTLMVMIMYTSFIDAQANFSVCSRCIEDRSKFREMTKMSIKEEILRKLGFSSAPNITALDHVNRHSVQYLINKLERESGMDMINDQPDTGFDFHVDEDDYHFQPSNIIVPPSDVPLSVRSYRAGGTLLYFKMSQKMIDSRRDLVKSELVIYLPSSTSRSDMKAHIHFHIVSKDKKTGAISLRQDMRPHPVTIRSGKVRKVTININKWTRNWLKNPSENLGLVVRVLTNTKEEIEISQRGGDLAPYLKLDIQDGAWRSRTKRTTNRVCSEEFDPEYSQCCMWPLRIDFEEFGWGWVLAPKSYYANFCSGDCSLGTITEYPHGALVQMQDAGQAGGVVPGIHSSAGPCCAPRKMSSISILYMDPEENVILGKLPNMKVLRCGCF